jgi:hypothetical protein
VFSLLFGLLFLLALPIFGLFVWMVLRKVLHLRLWFIAVLFLGCGLLLHFAVLSMFMFISIMFVGSVKSSSDLFACKNPSDTI